MIKNKCLYCDHNLHINRSIAQDILTKSCKICKSQYNFVKNKLNSIELNSIELNDEIGNFEYHLLLFFKPQPISIIYIYERKEYIRYDSQFNSDEPLPTMDFDMICVYHKKFDYKLCNVTPYNLIETIENIQKLEILT